MSDAYRSQVRPLPPFSWRASDVLSWLEICAEILGSGRSSLVIRRRIRGGEDATNIEGNAAMRQAIAHGDCEGNAFDLHYWSDDGGHILVRSHAGINCISFGAPSVECSWVKAATAERLLDSCESLARRNASMPAFAPAGLMWGLCGVAVALLLLFAFFLTASLFLPMFASLGAFAACVFCIMHGVHPGYHHIFGGVINSGDPAGT